MRVFVQSNVNTKLQCNSLKKNVAGSQEVFIRAHKLPTDFDYGKYLWSSFAFEICETIDVNISTWVFVLVSAMAYFFSTGGLSGIFATGSASPSSNSSSSSSSNDGGGGGRILGTGVDYHRRENGHGYGHVYGDGYGYGRWLGASSPSSSASYSPSTWPTEGETQLVVTFSPQQSPIQNWSVVLLKARDSQVMMGWAMLAVDVFLMIQVTLTDWLVGWLVGWFQLVAAESIPNRCVAVR